MSDSSKTPDISPVILEEMANMKNNIKLVSDMLEKLDKRLDKMQNDIDSMKEHLSGVPSFSEKEVYSGYMYTSFLDQYLRDLYGNYYEERGGHIYKIRERTYL